MRLGHRARMLRHFVFAPTLKTGAGHPGMPWPRPATQHPGSLTHDLAAAAADTSGLHEIVAVHRGQIIAEWYGRGRDYRWGRPLGTVNFRPETLHDIRSVSKSVVALLYGIAWHNGDVPDPSEPLLKQFGEYPDLAADPQRAELTVEHALTMTLGLHWREEPPYRNPENGEIAMRLSPDPWRYTLERPIEQAPGSQWTYNGGATEILSRIIARGTGVPLHDYAQSQLFSPLGIQRAEWMATPHRIAAAASGLRLSARDLARIGHTVLNDGQWENHQVIPLPWLERMLTAHTSTQWGSDYGYHWYMGGEGADRWFGGIGNGQQRLHVLPERQLVVVLTTGRYDATEWNPLSRVLQPILSHLDR